MKIKKKVVARKTVVIKKAIVVEDIPPIQPNEKKNRGQTSPGRFLIDFLARHNPHVARVREGLGQLSREDLVDRISLIYCEILGLSGTESM